MLSSQNERMLHKSALLKCFNGKYLPVEGLMKEVQGRAKDEGCALLGCCTITTMTLYCALDV
jgi:hypothetical protein